MFDMRIESKETGLKICVMTVQYFYLVVHCELQARK